MDSAHTPSCEFCGAPLPPMPYTFAGVTITVPASCDCPQAVAQREAEKAAEREAHDAELALRRQRMYRRAGIPERFVGVAPDVTALPAIEGGRGLYLWGSVGTLKTTAACATLKAYIDAHSREWYGTLTCSKTAHFVNASRMLDRWRATYDSKDEAEEAVTGLYGGCDLLVLDDLGKGKQTEWAVERVYRVLNDRYDARLPTIITTQYARADLGRRLTVNGDTDTAMAIVSRLYETCEERHLYGPDRRIANGNH